MNNLVKMKFNSYELKNDGSYLNENQANELVEKRNKQILTPEELTDKITKKSNLVKCLNPESDKKVFVYFSKEGEETDTPIHLYNSEGELIMTFPWNGNINLEGKYYKCKYVDNSLSKYSYGPVILPSIKEFKLTATESGNIFINSVRKAPGEIAEVAFTQFNYEGKPNRIHMPGFDASMYPNKEVANEVKDYLSKNKSDGIVFAGALIGGDAFLEYGKKHSYLI